MLKNEPKLLRALLSAQAPIRNMHLSVIYDCPLPLWSSYPHTLSLTVLILFLRSDVVRLKSENERGGGTAKQINTKYFFFSFLSVSFSVTLKSQTGKDSSFDLYFYYTQRSQNHKHLINPAFVL